MRSAISFWAAKRTGRPELCIPGGSGRGRRNGSNEPFLQQVAVAAATAAVVETLGVPLNRCSTTLAPIQSDPHGKTMVVRARPLRSTMWGSRMRYRVPGDRTRSRMTYPRARAIGRGAIACDTACRGRARGRPSASPSPSAYPGGGIQPSLTGPTAPARTR